MKGTILIIAITAITAISAAFAIMYLVTPKPNDIIKP